MESSLSYSFLDLYSDVADYMGIGRSPTGDNLAKAKRRTNDAYRHFLSLDWFFLKKSALLNIESGKKEYELPDDFGSLVNPFTVNGQDVCMSPVETSTNQINGLRNFSDTTGTPMYFAIQSDYSEGAGLRWKLLLYPTPNFSFSYIYSYKVLANELVNNDDIPMCSADLSVVLRAFCLAEVEMFDEEGSKNVWITRLYSTILPQAMNNDLKKRPRSVGNMGGDCIDPRGYLYGDGRLYYNGLIIDGW